MQILEPALSVIGMIGSLIVFAMTIIAARRERNNIAKQVRLYRETKAHERYIDALIDCHTYLLEGYRICHFATLITPTIPKDAQLAELDKLERVAYSLMNTSWRCKELDNDIQMLTTRFGSAATVNRSEIPQILLDISEMYTRIRDLIKKNIDIQIS